jgi:hypothetical protein
METGPGPVIGVILDGGWRQNAALLPGAARRVRILAAVV